MSTTQATQTSGPSPKPTGHSAMVIFGAGGDLTKRKLLPALYNLRRDGLLPDTFAVVGLGARDFNHQQFRELQSGEIKKHVTGDFDEATWE